MVADAELAPTTPAARVPAVRTASAMRRAELVLIFISVPPTRDAVHRSGGAARVVRDPQRRVSMESHRPGTGVLRAALETLRVAGRRRSGSGRGTSPSARPA